MIADTDKLTTIAGTVKTIIGFLVLVLGLFHISMPETVQTGLISIGVSGYLVIGWFHGYLTNKASSPSRTITIEDKIQK